uniref:Si:dkeyp-23e4.3 n=1 Tax=Sinocyclocheilus rhinocerous TaxID=307959 RepID=A0A673KEW5_9TELE
FVFAELEAKEACDWLHAAGFPQYAQLFTGKYLFLTFLIAYFNHVSMFYFAFRRLSTLNKCVEIKLELSRSKRRGDEEEDEDLYAISPKWSFDRKSKRWIRVDDNELLHSLNCPITRLRRSGSSEASFTDSGECLELCSTHSSSNADSDGGSASKKMAEEPEQSCSSSRCYLNFKPQSPDTSLSRPPSPCEHPILSSEERLPEKPPVEKGKSLLRKMEKLKLKGSMLQPDTQSGKARFVISGPIIQEGFGEEKLKHLQCLDLARLQDKTAIPASCSSPSRSSSSPSESSSEVSTPSPVTKVRSNCKHHGLPKQEGSQKQINEQPFNNQQNLDVNPVFEIPHGHKPGMFPTVLSHNSTFSPINNTSVNWRTGSFHGYQSRQCKSSSSKDQENVCSPLATCDHRVSIYDNVLDPMQILDDDVFSALDSVMERICDLQQLVTSLTDKLSEDGDSDFSHSGSPSPTSLTDFHLEIKAPEETNEAALEEAYNKSSDAFAHTAQPTDHTDRDLEYTFLSFNQGNPSTAIQAKSAPHVSMLQRLSLLRLTVGLFRKSGVKSRIQNLRDMVEADPDGMSFENQSAFDVADMVKQYFRDLPEPMFSSKLCESFLHIYQYFPKDQQFEGVQAAIYLLPDENREALQSLLLFLQEVVACVKENQMTANNIAVCLAPSLFHINSFKRDRTSMRSRQRKYNLGRPDQRDLCENLAGACSFTEDSLQNDADQDSLSHFGENLLPDRARLFLLTQKLQREAREKSKGWISCSICDHVDVAVKKVSCSAVCGISLHDFSITTFPFSSCRMWQSDHSMGSLFVSSTSVEHAAVAVRGVRAQVFCSFFLIEPLGSKKSRVTHLCRTDMRCVSHIP